MTKKQLHQVNWSRGQTDGDPVKGSVRRILNMDMDSFGRLDSRLPISAVDQTDEGVAGGGNCVHVDYTPDGHAASSWVAVVRPYGIGMIPVVSGKPKTADMENVSLSGVNSTDGYQLDVEESQIIAYGEKVFVSAVSTDGDLLGVFIIMAFGATQRFKAPVQCEGSELDPSHSLGSAGWIAYRAEYIKPALVTEDILGYGWLSEDGSASIPFSHVGIGNRYYDALESLAAKIGEAGSNGVGLLLFAASPDDQDRDAVVNGETVQSSEYQTPGMFGRNAVVQYKVQYVFRGGGMSRTSDVVSITFDDGVEVSSERTIYSIGIMPMVSRSIDPFVKGINIYRKIMDSGNAELEADPEFMLVKTVWVDSEAIEDGNQDVDEINIDRTGANEGFNLNYGSGTTTRNPFASWSWVGSRWRIPQYRKTVEAIGGDAHLTSGWMSYGSNCVVFADKHYGANCTIKVEDNLGESYIPGTADVAKATRVSAEFQVMLFSRMNRRTGLVNSLVRQGADFPRVTLETTEGDPYFGMWAAPPFNGEAIRGNSGGEANLNWSGHGFPHDMFAIYRADEEPTVDFDADGISLQSNVLGWSDKKIPIVAYRDGGHVTPDSESSFTGAIDDDFIDVMPEAIAVSGGRLLGIGGIQDGDRKPSRLWYSLFQSFGLVLDSAFMDYGARDDGTGIGISSFRNKILIHFSSATYVIDVSGGVDMSWRELGADTGVGLSTKHAVGSSPVGNVWLDKNGIYIFDGSRISEISYMEQIGIDVRDTFRRLILPDIDNARVHYRQDLKQVWVCAGENVMVFDVTTAAWHEHRLTEVTAELGSSFDIVSIFDIDGETIFAVKVGSTLKFMTPTESHSLASMEWGVDLEIDLGAPEIIKKTKRFYVDAMTEASGGHLNAQVSSQGGGTIDQDLEVAQVTDVVDPDVETVIRFSASSRGRKILVSLRKADGESWYGAIGSLGLSHKVKPIK